MRVQDRTERILAGGLRQIRISSSQGKEAARPRGPVDATIKELLALDRGELQLIMAQAHFGSTWYRATPTDDYRRDTSREGWPHFDSGLFRRVGAVAALNYHDGTFPRAVLYTPDGGMPDPVVVAVALAKTIRGAAWAMRPDISGGKEVGDMTRTAWSSRLRRGRPFSLGYAADRRGLIAYGAAGIRPTDELLAQLKEDPDLADHVVDAGGLCSEAAALGVRTVTDIIALGKRCLEEGADLNSRGKDVVRGTIR